MTGAATAVHQHGSLQSYLACLRANPMFMWLWLAESVNTMGSWLNYVAVLDLIERFTDGSGLALAGVIIVHFIPSLVLAPVAGVVADRFNRVRVLLVTSIMDGVLVLCMVFVTERSHLTHLYGLLVLQFSTWAFYTPARSALLPRTVNPSDLPAATTIDSFSWSLSGAIASSAGGLLASRLGIRACFVADAATYIVSVLCTLQISRELGNPKADEEEEEPAPVGSNLGVSSASMGLSVPVAGGIPRPLPANEDRSHRRHPSPAQRLVNAAMRGLSATVEGLRESSAYLTAHPDVLWIATFKGAGAATWGCVDVLNAIFSKMKSMQSLGDASVTLGIIFGAVGFAAVLAPILLNPIVGAKPASLVMACAGSLLCISAGHAIMAVATNIWVLLLGTLTRSTGSTLIWVYSTLALQLTVPGEVLGRLSAWEMAWYTVAEAGSGLTVGIAIDKFHIKPFALLRYVCAASLIVAAAWGSWAIQFRRKQEEFHESETVALVPRTRDAQLDGEEINA